MDWEEGVDGRRVERGSEMGEGWMGKGRHERRGARETETEERQERVRQGKGLRVSER